MSRAAACSASSLIALLCAVSGAGCGSKLSSLPSGAGTPSADYGAAYAQATGQCRGVRTLQASLNLSGKAGNQRLRGKIDAGFASPGQVRLEGSPPIPFGRPVFILVGRPSDATLVLPRDKRVLTEAPADAIIEALAGVRLTADELRAVVSGCGFGVAEPSGGRAHGRSWITLEGGGATTWLRNVKGSWRTIAASRGPLEVRYEEYAANQPARIRIRTALSSATSADITLRVSNVDINVPLEPGVFRIDVPEDAVPMTLEELRRSVPRAEDRATRTAGGR